MGRTVVIGLDGADWELLEDFIEDGTCPNIARLAGDGVRGDMHSVHPPISVPAWLCTVTGKRPDRLDLYNFTRRKPNSYEMHRVHNSEEYQRDAFWNELEDVGIFNVPSTFPAGSYDGFLVAGPLSPGGTHPEDLEEELEEEGYVRSLPKGWQFEESLDVLERNGDVAAELLEERDPGFFMAVTSVPDRVQHAYWGEEERMRELWEEVDRYVGKILEHVDLEEDDVFVISDHGFESIDKTFYLNTWLEENGYLETEGGGKVKEGVRFRLKKTAKEVLGKLGLLEFALENVPSRLRNAVENPEDIWDRIDWDETTAFASGQYIGQVYINTEEDYPDGTVSGEEYEEVRNRLISELEELEDPETGEKVVEKVWKKEDLYRDFGEFAPDITFYTRGMGYKVKEELHGSVFDESIPRGAHGQEGILVAAGENVGEGKMDMELVDVAPTLLHLEGRKIPGDMDGEAAGELFAEGSDPSEREVRVSGGETSGIDI
ncbi:MAG: alkaline phosphatase family protein, partial [Candidatus Nanohaloarchaea archaeon]